ncbi:hypothetical protein [Microvirga sp. 2TAF3]|uniref:hypothetical protein n=1 Tax=Microvirga sp. 2TAF3 TaxID=3233014 RepID=UPI003F969543
MKQITLSLVWLTIRIDVIPAALERVPKPNSAKAFSSSEPKASFRAKLGPHLLRDIGEDDSRRD